MTIPAATSDPPSSPMPGSGAIALSMEAVRFERCLDVGRREVIQSGREI